MKKILFVLLIAIAQLSTAQNVTIDIDSLILKDLVIKKDSFVHVFELTQISKTQDVNSLDSLASNINFQFALRDKIYPLSIWRANRATIEVQDAVLKQLLQQKNDNDKAILERQKLIQKLKKDKT